MTRAVERGKKRRLPQIVRHLGIDEKATKKRHKYFTIVSDLDKGEVLWVGRGHKRESIDAFYNGLSGETARWYSSPRLRTYQMPAARSS